MSTDFLIANQVRYDVGRISYDITGQTIIFWTITSDNPLKLSAT